MSDVSFEERQQHAVNSHRHRIRSVSPATVKRRARESASLRGCTISKSYLSSKGGKIYPQAVVESILASGKVSNVLLSSHQKSLKKAAEICERRKEAPSGYEVLSDGIMAFEPRVNTKESEKINSRMDTTFEDRMLKSMDEYRIKVKVNRENADITPGPGQYSSVDESNRCCPLPKSATSDMQYIRSKVRGANAYTFGRSKREDVI